MRIAAFATILCCSLSASAQPSVGNEAYERKVKRQNVLPSARDSDARIPDDKRIGVKANWLLNPSKIPFESQPIVKFFDNPRAIALRNFNFDALMSVKGKSQQLEILIGSKFRTVVTLCSHCHGVYEEFTMLPSGQLWRRASGSAPTDSETDRQALRSIL